MYSERATDVYTEKSLATVARFKCAALLPFTRLLFLFSDFICTQLKCEFEAVARNRKENGSGLVSSSQVSDIICEAS